MSSVGRGAALGMVRTPKFELTMDIDADEPPRRERNDRGNGCAVFGKGMPARVLSGERQGMAHVVSKGHDSLMSWGDWTGRNLTAASRALVTYTFIAITIECRCLVNGDDISR